MTTETGLIRPFLIPGLAPPGPDEQRQIAARRTLSWVLVGLWHVLLFFAFVIGFTLPQDRLRPLAETILMLAPPGSASLEKSVSVNPEEEIEAAKRFYAAPLAVPRPIVPRLPDQQQQQSQGITGTDILGAVGRTLSCSAGSWEHLTQNERNHCYVMPPWVGARLPNGNLVMVPASQLPRLREPPPDTGFVLNTGRDRLQRDLQVGGSSGCPIMLNIPCTHVSPGMRAMGDN